MPATRVLQSLIGICLFRATPQDIDHSVRLLVVLAALSVLVDVVVLNTLAAFEASEINALIQAALALAVVYGLLSIRGLSNRFVQTASALFGTSILFSLAALPTIHALLEPTPPSWALTLWLAVVIWSIAVLTHILRHAMNVSRPIAVVLALGYLGLSILVTV